MYNEHDAQPLHKVDEWEANLGRCGVCLHAYRLAHKGVYTLKRNTTISPSWNT